MKINKIILTNFRQYYGENCIDVCPENERNIVLIGGKNGYGKTNFLLSLVWCLFGEDIAKIDENFKHEIQKEGNYAKFLKNSLNWDANKERINKFSVQIHMSDIELPEIESTQSNSNYKLIVKREFDINTTADDFHIEIENFDKQLFHTAEDKIHFINDYVIPLEAAKFVFFDAEKIASWAELSTREEGNVLNDALGKILGLDIYESLISDLNTYTDTLRKDSANSQVRQQIITTEKGVDLNTEKIDQLETDIVFKENEISKFKSEISSYESFLIKNISKNTSTSSLDELYKKKDELYRKQKDLEEKFNELSEIIPFTIAAGKLEEVIEHLNKQDEDSIIKDKNRELIEKNNELIERLFNNAPFPYDGDISFSKKMFYAEKAKNIVEDIFGESDKTEEVEFEHDFSKSEKDLLFHTYHYIRKQSKDVIAQTIDSFNSIKEDIYSTEKTIRNTESNLEDEEVVEYSTKKSDAERKLEKLVEEKGALQNQRDSLKRDNEKLNQSLQVLLKRISVSEQKKKKLDKANYYIRAIENFVSEQKKKKCSLLEQLIFDEMKKLMHKLNTGSYGNFIAAVKAEPLPGNDGLRIVLFNKEGEIRTKESLSQGEKQIYISSLIKAILSLSIQEYPIFIDTPLGRLDDEHIKHTLLHYYPHLASQVILMATNNEIPPSRYKLVKENVARAFLLENINNKTRFKQGYFQSYEN
ncbi:DNA sulfur modification protein DndD [Filimonas zeae]|uniref:ABC transporter ATP-binding protein n=1 Tax=Filimonas zeae TaxID=1737353 RepID=A0A917J0E3_9BACT|nr:DNA sulfur modification protein DndD [Filimonas zeae]MDR6340432.1 DNA sulfur modification protein DndD [Filimonas zeae]GGH72708.1 ABC transporter ATP-binding protein [Filimonas zeae]